MSCHGCGYPKKFCLLRGPFLVIVTFSAVIMTFLRGIVTFQVMIVTFSEIIVTFKFFHIEKAQKDPTILLGFLQLLCDACTKAFDIIVGLVHFVLCISLLAF